MKTITLPSSLYIITVSPIVVIIYIDEYDNTCFVFPFNNVMHAFFAGSCDVLFHS